MFLARKITRAKWDPKSGVQKGEIPADAVTVDLRTNQNALSFWRCGAATEREIGEAVLAIAAAWERIDRLDVVCIREDALANKGLNLENTKGKTPVQSLIENHVDVCRLDYTRLGQVAHQVAHAIESGRHYRFTLRQVTDILRMAVENGLLSLEQLETKVRARISAALD